MGCVMVGYTVKYRCGREPAHSTVGRLKCLDEKCRRANHEGGGNGDICPGRPIIDTFIGERPGTGVYHINKKKNLC